MSMEGSIRFIPIPEEGKLKYITNAEICDESELLEMFTKMQEKDSQLVLYGETAAKIRETAKQVWCRRSVAIDRKRKIRSFRSKWKNIWILLMDICMRAMKVRIVRFELEWNFWEKTFL